MQRPMSPWIKVLAVVIVAVIASVAYEYFRSGGDVLGRKKAEPTIGSHGDMSLPPGHPPIPSDSLGTGGPDSAEVQEKEQAAQAHPKDPKAHIELANAYMDAGRLDDAMEHLNRALELDQKNAEAHRYKGKLYFTMDMAHPEGGYAEKSRDEYARALELKPDYAEACYYLAVMDHRVGDEESALKNLQKAIGLGAKDTMGLGMLLGVNESPNGE